MASMWRKAMLYLGLGPDEEYDDFDVTGEHQRAVQPRPVVRRTPGDVQHDPEPSGSVRTLSPSDDHDDPRGRAQRPRSQQRPPPRERAQRRRPHDRPQRRPWGRPGPRSRPARHRHGR